MDTDRLSEETNILHHHRWAAISSQLMGSVASRGPRCLGSSTSADKHLIGQYLNGTNFLVYTCDTLITPHPSVSFSQTQIWSPYKSALYIELFFVFLKSLLAL